MRRALAPSLALLALAVGCGESGDDRAAFLWEQRCAPCHALEPGQPSPALAAPNLGERRPTADEVRRAVAAGAPGMPPDLIGGDEVDLIVEYLQRHAG